MGLLSQDLETGHEILSVLWELRSSEFKLTFIPASALLAMHSIYIGQQLQPAAVPLIVHMCVRLGGVALIYYYPHPALWYFTRLSLCMFVCFAEMLSSSSTRSTSLLCLSSIKLKDTSIKLFLPVFQNSKNKYWSLHSCGLIVSCLLITFSHQTLIAGNKWCRSWKYKNMFVILVDCPSSFFPKWRDFRLN